ncbi:MAG: nucleotidyltransferase domain-containing protein [Bacteroidetes bacterium]|nr:nucleotidyltransferase domain-containing protein [Bacteroidota bacterium]MCH7974510.1 nucleotidyltransferase domain-containing protein [Bacteroidota bacterium]
MVIHRVFNEVFRTRSNVAVIRALLDTNTGFTGNEVARVSGMHPRSAFKALTLLEGLGIVNRQRGGRDHIFSLNREHFLVQEAILKIFQVESKFPAEVINTLASILKKQVYSAVIFGSAARREENILSDLDICCIVNSVRERLFVSDTLNKKSQILYNKFGINLAPIFFTKSEFIRKRKSQLVKSIANEGIIITGKNPKGLLNG